METATQIKLLPVNFTAKGDEFTQVFKNENFYIYKRRHAETDYFEVFKRKVVDCMDFETHTPTGERKETYPKDENFGIWAWCCGSLPDAMKYTE